ncbi:LytR/AlgR family response regulator transcription factor [Anaeromicrobium sediminis]|uniref:Stage 0 sporulation protein A homolog n=1 Tax=Anaeromicrobium sediminis TaxID=1478221 RepID=A0A267MIT8_9FIRM|nr:LytTR family DNA-binding domain-containing protein [Anaeromicrobium sediminis]PAB59504.1 DNA-binding response regulator [Anaeromicrobium sediminis]
MRGIIVEDEYPAREELKYFIDKYSSIDIIEEFESSVKALEFIEKKEVDIIFLDINMPNLNGMSFAKIINKFQKKPKIVFITAYKDYAIDAFEVGAFDYILKPYSEERIIHTLKKLERTNGTVKKANKCCKIVLNKGEKLVAVNPEDIYYCEASERETKVYTKDNVYMAKDKISTFIGKLPKENFFRSHRSYIINLDKIEEIIPWFNNTYNVRLQHMNVDIPVSRNNMKNFKRILNL